jgi:hypothetical protein
MAIRFSKRKIRCVDFKNREAIKIHWQRFLLADLTKSKALAKVAKSRSNTLVVEPIYPKPSIGQFSIEEKKSM